MSYCPCCQWKVLLPSPPLLVQDGRICCGCHLRFISAELNDCDGCTDKVCDNCIVDHFDKYTHCVRDYCPCCQWRIPPPPPPPPDHNRPEIPDAKNESVSRNTNNSSSSNNDYCTSIVHCSCHRSVVQPPNHKHGGIIALNASSADGQPERILDSRNKSVPQSEQEKSEREENLTLSICLRGKLQREQCQRQPSHHGNSGDSPNQNQETEDGNQERAVQASGSHVKRIREIIVQDDSPSIPLTQGKLKHACPEFRQGHLTRVQWQDGAGGDEWYELSAGHDESSAGFVEQRRETDPDKRAIPKTKECPKQQNRQKPNAEQKTLEKFAQTKLELNRP